MLKKIPECSLPVLSAFTTPSVPLTWTWATIVTHTHLPTLSATDTVFSHCLTNTVNSYQHCVANGHIIRPNNCFKSIF